MNYWCYFSWIAWGGRYIFLSHFTSSDVLPFYLFPSCILPLSSITSSLCLTGSSKLTYNKAVSSLLSPPFQLSPGILYGSSEPSSWALSHPVEYDTNTYILFLWSGPWRCVRFPWGGLCGRFRKKESNIQCDSRDPNGFHGAVVGWDYGHWKE